MATPELAIDNLTDDPREGGPRGMSPHLRTGSDQHKPVGIIEENIKGCAPPAGARQTREVFTGEEADGGHCVGATRKGISHWRGGGGGVSPNKSKGNKVGLSGSQRHGAIPPITSLDGIKAQRFVKTASGLAGD